MLEKVEIQEAISLYHEAASQFAFDRLAMAFLPDGIWEVPGMRIFSQGRDNIRTAMSDLMKPIQYLVQINAPAVIVVEGGNASARSLIRESAKFRDRPGLMDVVGQYVDDLERTTDGWKFARRTFTIIGSHMSAGTS